MANLSLSDVAQTVSMTSWEGNCLAQLLNSTDDFWKTGIVDAAGNLLPTLTSDARGVNLEVCYHYCAGDSTSLIQTFNFVNFANAATNYFLPWLSLTAQLPFETGDPFHNALAFCLALGSPMLITYSLTMTIFNRTWVRRMFAPLKLKAEQDARIAGHKTHFVERIKAVLTLLQEAQQAPLRASQERGWLSSLLLNPQNDEWWRIVADRLKDTRRGYTASLVAQMLLAIVAWLFTIISSFIGSLGDIHVGNQISSGNVWLWLPPVIIGWIFVGVQYKHDSIHRALRAHPVKTEATLQPLEQRAFLTDCTFVPPDTGVQTAESSDEEERLQIPTWYGMQVPGDEQIKGPLYNYARTFTWWQLSMTVHRTLDRAFKRTKTSSRHTSLAENYHVPQTPTPISSSGIANVSESDTLLSSTPSPTPRDNENAPAYREWTDMPPGIYQAMLAAAFVSLLLQWGTTGVSIWEGYTTPTMGIGCRSGSYILYGTIATLIWLLMLSSTLLSHDSMLRYQRVYNRDPTITFSERRRQTTDDESPPTTRLPPPLIYRRTPNHSFITAAAILTRCTGKLLAVFNTLFLIFMSVMELIGGFDNCWCKGDALNYGSKGFVTIFENAANLDLTARASWGGSLALALIVIVAYMLFTATCLATKVD